jgi:hypothetical protein
MELDRHLPLQGIPERKLVIDPKTKVSLAIRKRSTKLLGHNHQEQNGGRMIVERKISHDFYRDLKIDSHGDNDPIGY